MKPAQQTQVQPTTMLLVIAIFLVLVFIELLAILLVNGGHFMFALDDPYIHLALAENIWHGHYGVNAGEYAAPSSSILWPLLIAPLTVFAAADWLVLALNVACSIATLFFAGKALSHMQADAVMSGKAQLVVLVLFMLATNLVGLSFIGMEHNLQVLLAVLIAWGMLEKLQTQKTSPLLLLAIIAAPLVRYENAIIAAVALLYLFLQKDYLKSVLAGVVIVVCCALFSIFLLGIGLQYLPDSILAKSDVATAGLPKLLGNISNNFVMPNTPKAIAMLLLALLFSTFAVVTNATKWQRLLSACAALALLLHLLGGRVGWYFRYEMAIWAFALVLFFYLYKACIQAGASAVLKRMGQGMIVVIVLVALLESLVVLASTPLAASNIYHQQYQLHRFITEIYRKPVAVNDLGWTSYRNNNYVLDLWGLGSGRARELRKGSGNVQWMDDLAAEKNIELVMIYNNATWFPEVPKNWIKVAELDVTGKKITAWYPVSFFVRDEKDALRVKALLQQFASTLPEGSQLSWMY